MSMGEIIMLSTVYFGTINVLGALAFLLDKLSARENRYRIPEIQLLMLALLGGTIGCIAAQHFLRHKTHLKPQLYAIGVLQGVLLLGLLVLRG